MSPEKILQRTEPLKPANEATIEEAAALLQAGKLVAFPTETVYGLGGNARDDHAIAGIYALKGRPSNNPLIVHTASLAIVQKDVELTQLAEKAAAAFWPGALTLVLKRSTNCQLSPAVSASGDTVAIRIPAHPVAQSLLNAAQIPIAAPSANRSGAISPTEATHILESLDQSPAMILDGGPCTIGLESTVCDFSTGTPTILRPGNITAEELSKVLGCPVEMQPNTPKDTHLRSPGMLTSHYAPRLPVRLNATDINPNEAFLGFGNTMFTSNHYSENLSAAGDLQEAARQLFAALHRADQSGTKTGAHAIAIAPIPNTGVGIAINDRLRRAAAPR